MIDKMSFMEMVKYLNEAEIWFQSKRIDTANTRFATIKHHVELLAIEWAKYDAGQPHNFRELGNDIENSVYEAEPFILIYRFLNHINNIEFNRLLKVIVQGPAYSVIEDSDTNVYRNHLFELYLAAKLTEKGMTIKKFEDVVFDFEGFEIAIQCKRPFSVNSVGKLVRAADRQFKVHNRIETDPNVRGIIALSLDKILGLDKFLSPTGEFLIPKFHDEPAVIKFILESTDKFYNDYRTAWEHLFNGKVIAIFAFFRFPVVVTSENNMLTTSRYVVINPLVRDKVKFEKEYNTLQKLGDEIK